VESSLSGGVTLKEEFGEINYFDPIAQACLFGKLIRVYPEKTFNRVYNKIVSTFDSDTEENFQKIFCIDLQLCRIILTTYYEPPHAWKFRFQNLWNINSEESYENIINRHIQDIHYIEACRKYYYKDILSQNNQLRCFFEKLKMGLFINFRVDYLKYARKRPGKVKDLRATHIVQDNKGNLKIDNWPYNHIIQSVSGSIIKGDANRQSETIDLEMINIYHIWKNFPERQSNILEEDTHKILIQSENNIASKSFPFALFKKYGPLIKKRIFDGKKRGLVDPKPEDEQVFGERIKHEGIIPAVESFDPEKGPPANWIGLITKGLVTKKYRHRLHSTTEGKKYCTEDMKDVWYNCRYKRPKDKDNPECERRKNGLCTYSEAKRKTLKQIESEKEINCDHREYNKWEYQEYIQKKRRYSWDKFLEFASDDMDKKIIECLKTGGYGFRKSKNTFNINYSAVGRKTGISYMTVQRRFKKLITKVKK